MLPGIYPEASARGGGEGYGALEHVAGAHEIVAAQQPVSAVAKAYLDLARDPRGAAAWLRSLRIGYVAIDGDARRAGAFATSPDPQALVDGARSLAAGPVAIGDGVAIVPLAPVPPQVEAVSVRLRDGAPSTTSDGSVDLLASDPANVRVVARLTGRRFDWAPVRPSDDVADPSLAPVLGRNVWQRIPEVAALPGSDAVAGVGLSVPLPSGFVPVFAAQRTPSRTSCCLAFRGPFALLGAHSPLALRERVVARSSGAMTVRRLSDTAFDVVQRSGSSGALVLRTAYDGGWRLVGVSNSGASANEAAHFRADGWANGWLVALRAGDHVRLEYAPAPVVRDLEYFSAGLWLCAVLGAGLLWFRGRHVLHA